MGLGTPSAILSESDRELFMTISLQKYEFLITEDPHQRPPLRERLLGCRPLPRRSPFSPELVAVTDFDLSAYADTHLPRTLWTVTHPKSQSWRNAVTGDLVASESTRTIFVR